MMQPVTDAAAGTLRDWLATALTDAWRRERPRPACPS